MPSIRFLAVSSPILWLTIQTALGAPSVDTTSATAAQNTTSCVNMTTGVESIVDSPSECMPHLESALQWNQQESLHAASPLDSTSASAAAEGQSWSSNSVLPNSFDPGYMFVAPPSGVGSYVAFLEVPSVVLPIASSCTPANLRIAVLGAVGTSTVQMSLISNAPKSPEDTFATFRVNLSCTVRSNSGAPVSCSQDTSPPPQLLPAGAYLALLISDLKVPSDFRNARVLASFSCE
jgi:hypothetical protein